MTSRFATLAIAAVLFAAGGACAHAQERTDDDQAVLPIWNKSSGQLEALLVLEPTDDGMARAGTRWRFGSNRLDASFGLETGDSLGLLCDHNSGFGQALGTLANNCMLAALDDDFSGTADDADNRRGVATAALTRTDTRFGVSLGETRGNLPAWMTPGTNTGASQVDSNDLTVFAQRNISDQGYVSIAGTVARARLIPYAQAPAGLADRWSSRSLSVGGGIGDFGASIIGHVIDTPGQPRWEGLGLGLTWRTPWSGQLTVGAENVVTRGRNPFSPDSQAGEDEGTVPYVRYEQDL